MNIPSNSIRESSKLLARIRRSRFTLPVLTHVLATLDATGITLAVTDLDRWLETRMDAPPGPNETESFLIPPDAVKAMKPADKNTAIKVTCKGPRKQRELRLVMVCGGNDLMSLTAWQLVAGSLVLLGLSAVFEPHPTITWTGGFVGVLLFLALVGTALSTWLWFWLLQRAEAGCLSLYLFLVPVSGLLIAMSGFGERLNLLQAGGAGLILMAVALSVFEGWSGAVKRTNPPTKNSQKFR